MRSKSVRSKTTEAVPKEALLSAPPHVETTEECNQRVENPDIIQNIKVASNEDVDEVPSENIQEERTTETVQSLEERRKKVEEENRRKKRLLAKAIAERYDETCSSGGHIFEESRM